MKPLISDNSLDLMIIMFIMYLQTPLKCLAKEILVLKKPCTSAKQGSMKAGILLIMLIRQVLEKRKKIGLIGFGWLLTLSQMRVDRNVITKSKSSTLLKWVEQDLESKIFDVGCIIVQTKKYMNKN